MSDPLARIIARTVTTDHWLHDLELVAIREGCRYEQCRRHCGTRRIIIDPRGIPFTPWLRGEPLPTASLTTAPLFTLSRVKREAEMRRAA